MTLAMLLAFSLTFADSTQAYYAADQVADLQALFDQARGREERLLCRYRLYPLTESERYIDDLPASLNHASARELALLSGLWGYRAARAALPSMIRYGRRSETLMDQARRLDPDDPFVLLVHGQSLLFKPAFVGGNKERAFRLFRHLRDVVARRPHTGISIMEADLWTWYALHKMGDERAETLRGRLLEQNPPALYRKFLETAS